MKSYYTVNLFTVVFTANLVTSTMLRVKRPLQGSRLKISKHFLIECLSLFDSFYEVAK